MDNYRIGQGFDVHRLVLNRPLILGGVTIPFERGLEGHSDADVLTHAVMDALLGAAGLRDIGYYFPPSDSTYKDADSIMLLRKVASLLREAGISNIINIDTIIMSEKPKLQPFIPEMRVNIARALELEETSVTVKATTTERLGFVGREEGIAASAVCLLKRSDG